MTCHTDVSTTTTNRLVSMTNLIIFNKTTISLLMNFFLPTLLILILESVPDTMYKIVLTWKTLKVFFETLFIVLITGNPTYSTTVKTKIYPSMDVVTLSFTSKNLTVTYLPRVN